MHAGEVVEAHLARIAAAEGDIHAFNLVTADGARSRRGPGGRRRGRGRRPRPLGRRADRPQGQPLHPRCPHDLLIAHTGGLEAPIRRHRCPPVAAAGAVFVGKANLDEFAMGSSTENSAFGPTRNPHDTRSGAGRLLGRQRGGGGRRFRLVGARLRHRGINPPAGGTVGVVGAKPTYGVVSRYGLVAFASSLDQIGPFARSVADAALLLDVIAGPDPADSTSLPATPPVASARLGEGVDGLRVGVVTELLDAEGMASTWSPALVRLPTPWPPPGPRWTR